MLTGLRVLVVEDGALVSMMIEDILEVLGCEVVATASRLDDAITKAQALAVDMAVLDVNLAGQVSYPVADILRARHIPFVFATGYGMAGLPTELQDAPVLSKPFREDQLAEALRMARP